MKPIRVLAGCAFATFIALPALAATDVHVSINLGNAPPPPVVVVQHAPRTVWLPESRVYVVNDDDFDDDYFQCGSYWYVLRGDYWYRARTWRGPYGVIEQRYVPHSIMVVPANHWKHHPHGGPPGQMKKRDIVYVDHRGGQVERGKDRREDRRDDRREDRREDRGKDKGKDHR